MINKVLIANRGEIAGRIISTCQRLGIGTVAVFSEADRNSLHVQMADEAVLLGPAQAAESYLRIDKIIEAAKRTGADAIHPGYGFLAENADFAREVTKAGLIFVGPSADVIDQMGSKVAAREICQQAGAPTVPGSGALGDDELLAWAEQHGFPVMLKASAGGGGKGMRRLNDKAALAEALPSARREALKAFSDDSLYLEKAVVEARHLEVQILGDQHGNVLHLGVRDCSLQRRHQKVIEESPPPNASPQLLKNLTDAALKLARQVNYSNAGTVEFLAKGEEIYFLEMNTRLQVEHPVTELVTGLDLVELQLRVAEGEKLEIRQEQIPFQGHSVEARITCEKPYDNFLPDTGAVLKWRPCPQTRCDSVLESGSEISPYYDSMVAKIVSWGANRKDAIRRLKSALDKTALLGVHTNIDLLRELLLDPKFQEGTHHTAYLESLGLKEKPVSKNQILATAASRKILLTKNQMNPLGTPSLNIELPFANDVSVRVSGNTYHLGEESHELDIRSQGIEVDGHYFPILSAYQDGKWWTHTPEGTVCLEEVSRLPEPSKRENLADSLKAPMPGSVVEILVNPGDKVSQGQTLVKMEAMKMEQVISCPYDGTVEAVHFQVGDQVESGEELLSVAVKEV